MSIYRKLSRGVRLARWAFPRLNSLLYSRPLEGRRVLIVYDLSRQPFSIGDFLVAHIGALVIREIRMLDKIDCAVVYDPDPIEQNRPEIPGDLRLNTANVTNYLWRLLPAVQANQYLGSLFVFDSHSHMEDFISDNGAMYQVWPDFWSYVNREELYRPVNDLVYDFYVQYGWFPSLSCSPFLRDWAQSFYRQHTASFIPVTVNIRLNRWYATRRNTHMESWLAFFDHCKGIYPAKFIIVSSPDEVDDRLRCYPNVLIAKDFHTSMEQDLALIHSSAIHFGSASGPATMAVYSTKPYLLVNADMLSENNLGLYRNVKKDGPFVGLGFAGPYQRFLLPPETPELLIGEFERIWNSTEFRGAKLQRPPL